MEEIQRCPRQLHEKLTIQFHSKENEIKNPILKTKKRIHVGCTNLQKSNPILKKNNNEINYQPSKLSNPDLLKQFRTDELKTLILSPVKIIQPNTSDEIKKNLNESIHFLNLEPKNEKNEKNEILFNKNSPFTKSMFQKNRNKIRDRVATKFGSMRAMFRAFDENGTGGITFEQFQKSIHDLGLDIDKNDLKLLYKMVDKNENNLIDFTEFSEIFENEPMRNSFLDTGNNTEILKAKPPVLNLSPRTNARIQEFRNILSQKLLKKHVSQQVVYGSNSKVLLNAFRHMDHDGDGSLTFDELKKALGRDMLDLEIDPNELEAMVTTIDTDQNGFISYKEFINYFSIQSDNDQMDIFQSGRERELEKLKNNFTQEKNPRPKYIPFDDIKNDELNIKIKKSIENEPGCMQEQLSSKTSQFLKSKSNLNPLKNNFKNNENYFKTLNQSKSTPIIKSHHMPIEWSRIGIGGDGIDKNSGLYLSDLKRFQTTYQQQFKPLKKRIGIEDIEKKKNQLEEKHQRTYHNLLRIEHNKEYHTKKKEWEEKSRIQIKSKQKYFYNEKMIEKEEKIYKNKNKMAKKSGGPSFHRMWAGSLESQFNSQPWGISKQQENKIEME